MILPGVIAARPGSAPFVPFGLGVDFRADAPDDNTLDPRLAGCVFVNTTDAFFRIDLPAAGKHSVQLALGRAAFAAANQRITVFDNVTSRLVITASTGPDGGWKDAQNILYITASSSANSTAWAAINPAGGNGMGAATLSFASTILRFQLGGNGSVSLLSTFWVNNLP